MTDKVETEYATGWREGYEAASGAAMVQLDELRAKLDQYQVEFREQITEEHAAYQELYAENKRLQTDCCYGERWRCPRHRAQSYETTAELGRALTEIERLRIEMHRLAESRRGQRERAERAEAEIERLKSDPVVDGRVPYLQSQNQRLQTQIETAKAVITGSEKEIERLRADPVVDGRVAYLESRNERLRATLAAVQVAIDSFDSQTVSPTPDQRDVIDAVRRAIRSESTLG